MPVPGQDKQDSVGASANGLQVGGPEGPSSSELKSNFGIDEVASFLATAQSVGRDPHLQQLADGYQRQSMRDLLSLNEYNPALSMPGEPLYLPINFVSHLRGHRSDNEEILKI